MIETSVNILYKGPSLFRPDTVYIHTAYINKW